GRHAERVFAADRDEGVHAGVGEVRLDPLDAPLDLEGVGPGRAEDRATAREDAPNLLDAQRLRLALERAPPAVPEPHELVAIGGHALADDRPAHRVETGAVAATGQHSDSHCSADLQEVLLRNAALGHRPPTVISVRRPRTVAPLPARKGRKRDCSTSRTGPGGYPDAAPGARS